MSDRAAIDQVSELYAAYLKGWDAALRRAAIECRCLDGAYANVTPSDCIDAINSLLNSASEPQELKEREQQ